MAHKRMVAKMLHQSRFFTSFIGSLKKAEMNPILLEAILRQSKLIILSIVNTLESFETVINSCTEVTDIRDVYREIRFCCRQILFTFSKTQIHG